MGLFLSIVILIIYYYIFAKKRKSPEKQMLFGGFSYVLFQSKETVSDVCACGSEVP